VTRFQLIFRHKDGDRRELWDNNHDGEPHIDGKLIIDGDTYTIHGIEWIVKTDSDGLDGIKRFVCTLAVSPHDDESSRVA
jgi:hypothetical protein